MERCGQIVSTAGRELKFTASLSSHWGWEPIDVVCADQPAGHRLGQRRVESISGGQRENNQLGAVLVCSKSTENNSDGTSEKCWTRKLQVHAPPYNYGVKNLKKPLYKWQPSWTQGVATQFPVPLFKPVGESRPYLQIIMYICSNLAGDAWRTDLLSHSHIIQNTSRKSCRLYS